MEPRTYLCERNKNSHLRLVTTLLTLATIAVLAPSRAAITH